MKKLMLFLITSYLLSGCLQEDLPDVIEVTTVEQTYEELSKAEQTPLSEALEKVSFVPKKINEETLPFTVKKRIGKVMETEENSEMIHLGYGGFNHRIDLIVENTVETKKEPSLDYKEILLDNGRTALYAEDENTHYVTWFEKRINYLLVLHYKTGTGETPERYTKEEVIKIVNELEE
ncbi:hypothetical protein V1502_11015 [Bacillus sp. SCS-153A]|uniref:hypothetical protein n=1 Tax=Rossellomorea sedimentorum TaxID=3115294 RepID=UPI0039062B34